MLYIGTFVQAEVSGTLITGQITETSLAHYTVKVPDGEVILSHRQVAPLADQTSPRCKCGELVATGILCSCGRGWTPEFWWILEDTPYCVARVRIGESQ